MMSASLHERLESLELQLNNLCITEQFDEILKALNESHDFIYGLDVSVMDELEKQSFISFSKVHHDVMLSVREHRKEALEELKKCNIGKKKIKQYKGIKNSAG